MDIREDSLKKADLREKKNDGGKKRKRFELGSLNSHHCIILIEFSPSDFTVKHAKTKSQKNRKRISRFADFRLCKYTAYCKFIIQFFTPKKFSLYTGFFSVFLFINIKIVLFR